jgi:hypothetical protein
LIAYTIKRDAILASLEFEELMERLVPTIEVHFGRPTQA